MVRICFRLLRYFGVEREPSAQNKDVAGKASIAGYVTEEQLQNSQQDKVKECQVIKHFVPSYFFIIT
ncbi:MAG: hypothetical protein MJZ20_08960 [Bacteroidaceae bacterium]|nr:hypothetical protein [Bacteroidaceae bacterium]